MPNFTVDIFIAFAKIHEWHRIGISEKETMCVEYIEMF